MASQIETTKLIQVNKYNPKKCMIFSKPRNKNFYSGKQKNIYKIINILSKNDDDSIGYLIIPTGRLFSFGITENCFNETQSSYSFPLCLWSRDGATKDEKKWIKKFNEIVDCCMDHVLKNKEEIEKCDLTKKDLIKLKGGLNPLYWKKEIVVDKKGNKILQNNCNEGPALYPKIDYSKRDDVFFSAFYDKDDNEIKPKDLIGKCCFAESCIRIESIYIGDNITLQVKLNDAIIEVLPPKSLNSRFMYTYQKSCPEVKIISIVVKYEDEADEEEDEEEEENPETEDEYCESE